MSTLLFSFKIQEAAEFIHKMIEDLDISESVNPEPQPCLVPLIGALTKYQHQIQSNTKSVVLNSASKRNLIVGWPSTLYTCPKRELLFQVGRYSKGALSYFGPINLTKYDAIFCYYS